MRHFEVLRQNVAVCDCTIRIVHGHRAHGADDHVLPQVSQKRSTRRNNKYSECKYRCPWNQDSNSIAMHAFSLSLHRSIYQQPGKIFTETPD